MQDHLSQAVEKMRAFYDITPDAPIYQKEFGYYVLDRWIEEGYLRPRSEVADYERYLQETFGYDEPATVALLGAGWTEGALYPAFEVKVLEDPGKYELVQDTSGRSVLCFKGRRSGFMPEYVDHPVKDFRTWEERVKWRLNPNTEGRMERQAGEIQAAIAGAEVGKFVVQRSVGGYMYLRSLMGPEDVLYKFYDEPELIHDCMKTWFELTDAVAAYHQRFVSIDELFLGEDICYKSGSLISPDMIKEFLFPYYQQLYTNIKRRNLDKSRKVHFQIDTDGNCLDVIDLYKSIGVDSMSPFEVASDCDVVAVGRQHPDLRISGGIDKRVLAEGKEAIDRHLDSILPAMRRRGGYIPTCDHGVPEEVSFENYMHYRKRLLEYAN